MNKEMTNRLIELTQECLERYWQHDYQYVLSYCSADVGWIGATQSQFMQGIEAVTADFANTDREIKRCHLNNQEFFIAHNDVKSCSVCGRYLVTTDEGEDVFLQVQQRCTFIWKMEKDKPKIQCINVSNPMGELTLNEGEQFPNWLGVRTLNYLSETIALSKKQNRFAIMDKEGGMYFVYENEIEYVQADGHDIELHLMDKVRKMHLRFSEFVETYGSQLVLVHRSYAVNPLYIVSIVERKITMQSGAVIPIPEKKLIEVKEILKKRIENSKN